TSKILLGVFFVTFLMLMWLGLKPADGIYVLLARIFTVLYFGFFVALFFVSKWDGNGPVPDRVTYDAH
ncbi:MAG TPA: cytochrome bc complex cytochrome b subunit, partial [Steroidobacteraceae bacterium]